MSCFFSRRHRHPTHHAKGSAPLKPRIIFLDTYLVEDRFVELSCVVQLLFGRWFGRVQGMDMNDTPSRRDIGSALAGALLTCMFMRGCELNERDKIGAGMPEPERENIREIYYWYENTAWPYFHHEEEPASYWGRQGGGG